MITVRFRPHLQPMGHQRGCSGASDARPAAPPCTHRRLSGADWELLSPHHCIFSIRLLYQMKAPLSTVVLHNLIQSFLYDPFKLYFFPIPQTPYCSLTVLAATNLQRTHFRCFPCSIFRCFQHTFRGGDIGFPLAARCTEIGRHIAVGCLQTHIPDLIRSSVGDLFSQILPMAVTMLRFSVCILPD